MLKISNIVLDNFCQHEHLDIAFPVGLTGVLGRNGSGKSNCANGIYAAFTGQFNRHPEGASGCIRQGHDSAYVEVQGEIAEQKFRLRRELFPTRIKHTLWIDGEKYSDKAKDIELWMTEASGLTPQMMSEFVFIESREFYSFLEANDTERSKKFTALCNTKIYERLRDEYGELLKIDRSRYEAASEASLEVSKQSVAEAEENIRDLDKVLDEIQADIDTLSHTKESGEAAIKEYQDILADLKTFQTNAESLKRELDKLVPNQRELDRYTAEFNKLNQEYTDCLNSLAEILNGENEENLLADLREDRKIETERETLQTSISDLQDRIDKVVVPAKPDEKVGEELETVIKDFRAELAAVSKTNKDNKALLDIATKIGFGTLDINSDDAYCPLCGAKTEYWSVDFADIQKSYDDGLATVAELNADINERQHQLDQWDQEVVSYNNAAERVRTLTGQLKDVEKQLAGLPEPAMAIKDIDDEINYITGLISKRDLLKSKRATAERSVKLYETRIQEISDEVTRIETALDVLRDKFNKGDGYFNKESNDYIDLDKPEVRQALITDNEEHIADVNCILDELHRLEEEMTSTSGRKQEAVRSLKEWKRKVKEQEDLIAGLGSTKIWFERCEKAISWFKKDGLPRLIHRSILKQLTTIINTELESFGKPFSVEVNDDLTFTATFPNGVIMNSRALSDGQKVMLAMAFWIAVNRTFAQNIGIMILDEPTSGLDSVNSACLYGILERLKKSLHQRGQQVVIITFDEEMTSVLDEVYHVVKPEDNL